MGAHTGWMGQDVQLLDGGGGQLLEGLLALSQQPQALPPGAPIHNFLTYAPSCLPP